MGYVWVWTKTAEQILETLSHTATELIRWHTGTFVYAGGGLDGELDWRSQAAARCGCRIGDVLRPVSPVSSPWPRAGFARLPRVFRFGPILLTLATLVALLGYAVGRVMMFGLSGFVLLFPESLVGAYLGRYAVPIVGPMGAAAGITLSTQWRLETARRAQAAGGA